MMSLEFTMEIYTGHVLLGQSPVQEHFSPEFYTTMNTMNREFIHLDR